MSVIIGPSSFLPTPPMADWVFLGQATANAAVRTGTVIWTGVYKQLLFECHVPAMSNTSVPRLIVGPSAGLSETGTTFCCNLIEGVTQTTTAISIPGWPMGVTVAATRYSSWMYVKNVANQIKTMTGFGNNAGTAPTTVPICTSLDGLFNDTTNSIQRAELATYTTITGTTIGTRTMNAGTYLNVWGRNDN